MNRPVAVAILAIFPCVSEAIDSIYTNSLVDTREAVELVSVQNSDLLGTLTPIHGTRIEAGHGVEIYGCDVIVQNEAESNRRLQEGEKIQLGLPYDLRIYYRLVDLPYENPSHHIILKSDDNSTFYSFPMFSEFLDDPPRLGETRARVISIVPRLVVGDLNVYLSLGSLQHVEGQHIRSIQFEENPRLKNIARGRPCEFVPDLNWHRPQNASWILTDGNMPFSHEAGLVGWIKHETVRIELDLGDIYRVRALGVKAKGGGVYNIYFPSLLTAQGKKRDGSDDIYLGSFVPAPNGVFNLRPEDRFYANTWFVVSCDIQMRYISLLIWPNYVLGCDEIVVLAETD